MPAQGAVGLLSELQPSDPGMVCRAVTTALQLYREAIMATARDDNVWTPARVAVCGKGMPHVPRTRRYGRIPAALPRWDRRWRGQVLRLVRRDVPSGTTVDLLRLPDAVASFLTEVGN